MLQTISWQEFFTTIGLIVLGYYFITGLLLFRNELGAFIKGSARPLFLFRNSPPNGEKQSDQLIGATKRESSKEADPREATVSAEDLLVVSSSVADEPIEITSIAVTVEDDVTSLSSEIEALARLVSTRSRQESLPLFQTLISRYSNLVDTDHVESLSQLVFVKVSEHCSFQFDLDEIRGWWSQADERIRHKSK